MGTSLVERRRHRSWPDDLKREIVAASLEPGSSVSLVARRYDVNANQVFAWRKRYRSGPTEPTGLQLMPVTVTPDRVVEPGPTACLCCGGARLRKLGEDVTETLEVIPRQWKVIQHV